MDVEGGEQGGPYHVEFAKSWKPIFICYVDAIFAITYFTFVVLHYWTQIGVNAQIHEIFDFMPKRIVAFMIILTVKFFADLIALKCFSKSTPQDLNRSKTTERLFWFRIVFDFVIFWAVM